MSNYIGVKCPVCNKKFTQADDIVVCPVCGAPHHRACYAQENTCAFAADHLSGKEWRAPMPDANDPFGSDNPFTQDNANGSRDGGGSGSGSVTCNVCQAKNPKDTIFCQSCGSRIGFNPGGFWGGDPYMGFDPSVMVYGGLRPDDRIEDETARDLAVYLGPNSSYYLPKFKKIAEAPYSLNFNLAALVFGFFYFFYRKMYLIGGILLGFFLISYIPSLLYMQEFPIQYMQDNLPVSMHHYLGNLPNVEVDKDKLAHYQQLVYAAGSINFVLSIVVAISANRFYYIKALADVKRIRVSQPQKHNEIAYSGELKAKGGVSKTAVIIVITSYCVSYFIPFYIMFSKYLEILQMGGTPPL